MGKARLGCAVLLLAGWLPAAQAEVVTEQGASILVFPKVVVDGTRDTLIQITNTGNSTVHAHCFYVNGALTFPDLDPGPSNPPLWTEIDFDIWLTRQQPTYWLASEGRLVDPTDVPCRGADTTCRNAGIDPGRVPPVVDDFTGELKCIEVDASGAPLSGNHLRGEATILTRNVCDAGACTVTGTACSTSDDCANLCNAPGQCGAMCRGIGGTGTCRFGSSSCTTAADCPEVVDVAKYNGLGLIGFETNNGDGILCIGGVDPSEGCDAGAEYGACPEAWVLQHVADGAADPAAEGSGSTVPQTTITVVPCAQNFETQDPTSVTLQFSITNEMEQTFSASTTVTCWAELGLSAINEVFQRSSLGTDLVQTRIRPSSGTQSGFLVVADQVHEDTDGARGLAATNLVVEGERGDTDRIVIPGEQLPPLP